ncbi:MAG TPA: immunoglobulin domain-containing protein [Terriglobales bacterium]|nr:immunoglobulin domain-containing protein [Terriglobales bacterium]
MRRATELLPVFALLVLLVSLSSCGGGGNSSPAPMNNNSAPTITAQPSNQTVAVGQTATFSVTATGTPPLSYQWQRNGANISGATGASYTTPPVTNADNGAQFKVVVSNSLGNVTSNAATLTIGAASSSDITTFKFDVARTGQNLQETTLTPSNVNVNSFGKVGFFPVDGKVDAQPLYVSNLTAAGQGTHNVLYVATEHDSVYAFDAASGAVLWHVSVLKAGETTSDDHGCSQITPEIGITSTPVIDRTRGPNGAIYVVAISKDGNGNYFQRIHALDLANGSELFGGPTTIQASYPGTGAGSVNGQVIFAPGQYAERVGLLLLNGTIYLGWTSHCDIQPYTGWIMGYDAASLQQVSVINLTPNGSEGSIWMSGTGLAADSGNNIYFLDANGTFDTTLNSSGFPSQGDFGNSFMKLSTARGLHAADYFAPFNTVQESNADEDLGSGGAMVLPDLTDNGGQVHHLAVGAGKDANIYVVNRDNMGKFNASTNNIYQEIQGALANGVFASPAYFNNTVYYGAPGDSIKAFTISNARLSNTATSRTGNVFGYPGASPAISANGNSAGILWAAENGSTAVLHAYDATNLAHELYNSNQAGARDQFGAGNKFITPLIANGRVYVGTTNGVAVFGLRP